MPSRLDPEIQHLVGLVNTGQLDTNLSAAQAIEQVPILKLRCVTDDEYERQFPKYWSRLRAEYKREGILGRRFGEPTPPDPQDFPPAPKPKKAPKKLKAPTPLRVPAPDLKNPPQSIASPTSQPASKSVASREVDNNQDYDDSDDNNHDYSDCNNVMSHRAAANIDEITDRMTRISTTGISKVSPAMIRVAWSNMKEKKRLTFMLNLPGGADNVHAVLAPPKIKIVWTKPIAFQDANIFHRLVANGQVQYLTQANEPNMTRFANAFQTQIAATTQSQLVRLLTTIFRNFVCSFVANHIS